MCEGLLKAWGLWQELSSIQLTAVEVTDWSQQFIEKKEKKKKYCSFKKKKLHLWQQLMSELLWALITLVTIHMQQCGLC